MLLLLNVCDSVFPPKGGTRVPPPPPPSPLPNLVSFDVVIGMFILL